MNISKLRRPQSVAIGLNPTDYKHIDFLATKGVIVGCNCSGIVEEATTLGVSITTVGQGLYQSLGLPWPTTLTIEPSSPILIYSGSTATGTLAVQFAKISGLTIIRAVTDNKLRLAFDCIAGQESAAICAEAISSNGGTYSSLLTVQEFPRKDVVSRATLAYTGIGEAFHKGLKEFPANPGHLEFQVKFWKLGEGVVGAT
ncbi:hypothetical protein MPDQ_002685 [Monascus purpureus]|uniref:Uncharacterized protein n=1 Tax=Monascus purpureus TaxID=5098 RepID=A0A507QJZ6_MONPU|nr:hypothetical protein MPDQ_002685 [Monascus purpureus]